MTADRTAELIAERPVPGHPRPYDFPDTFRTTLDNGLRVIVTPMPGRELVAASLALRSGAVDEPAAQGGATVLSARGLTEGTEVRDAIELTEAAERLGASLHAESGWDATSAGLDVPESRLGPALELLAEIVRRPAFPEAEIDRLRDERLTDILQARADPRRRADEAFIGTIYAPSSPYHRPSGGAAETVAGLTSAELRAVHTRAANPAQAALVVAGDVDRRCRRRARAVAVRRLVRPRPGRLDRDRRHARQRTRGSSGSSTGRAPSRARSGSATRAFRAATPTTTPCR